MKEIEENEYNLNIPRYVDTFEPEKPIDIRKIQDNLNQISKEISEVDKELNQYLKKLGLNDI